MTELTGSDIHAHGSGISDSSTMHLCAISGEAVGLSRHLSSLSRSQHPSVVDLLEQKLHPMLHANSCD